MSNVILFNPADSAFITFDWSGLLPQGVTLSSVVHTPPAPLGKASADLVNGSQSQVKLNGTVHGQIYQIAAKAQLSNGETINRVFPIRSSNS